MFYSTTLKYSQLVSKYLEAVNMGQKSEKYVESGPSTCLKYLNDKELSSIESTLKDVEDS